MLHRIRDIADALNLVSQSQRSYNDRTPEEVEAAIQAHINRLKHVEDSEDQESWEEDAIVSGLERDWEGTVKLLKDSGWG